MTQEQAAGVLVVDKPQGWTSHDVVAKVRQVTGLRRVGHTGTLDPMATGVLVLCLGQATRLAEFLSSQPKTYLAEITLGASTDTYDATGQVTEQSPVPALERGDLDRALEAFRGDILQTPPAYAALKRQGEPLYRRARRGETVTVEARPARVSELALLAFDGQVLRARVACSAGTYVRSIAHDLGQALGCGAHLSYLRRIAVGPFTIEEAVSIDDLVQAAAAGRWEAWVLPPGAAVAHLPAVVFQGDEARRLVLGQAIAAGEPAGDALARAYDDQGTLLAIVRHDPERRAWRPVKVLVQPA